MDSNTDNNLEVKSNKNNNAIIKVLIVLIIIVSLVLVGYICYDKGIIFKKKDANSIQKTNKNNKDNNKDSIKGTKIDLYDSMKLEEFKENNGVTTRYAFSRYETEDDNSNIIGTYIADSNNKIVKVMGVDAHASSILNEYELYYPVIYEGNDYLNGEFYLFDVKNNKKTKISIEKRPYFLTRVGYIPSRKDPSKVAYLKFFYGVFENDDITKPVDDYRGFITYSVELDKIISNKDANVYLSKDDSIAIINDSWEYSTIYDALNGKIIKNISSFYKDNTYQSSFECNFASNDNDSFITCLYGSFGEGTYDKVSAFTRDGNSLNEKIGKDVEILQYETKDDNIILKSANKIYTFNSEGNLIN